jgi:hypothetical protein
MKSIIIRSMFFLASQAGFAQNLAAPTKYMLPYLQNMKPTSVYINWLTQDGQTNPVSVAYGLTSALGKSQVGTFTALSSTNNYCTVQLTGLTPCTTYYYKCISGNSYTAIYQFRTFAAIGASGQHIVFPIFGDTRSATDHVSPDTMITGRNSRLCEETLKENLVIVSIKTIKYLLRLGIERKLG